MASDSSTSQRRSANYQPNIWDDSYIQSLKDDSMEEEHVELWGKLKEEVRLLIGSQKEELEQLEFIDALTQLGVSHRFDMEIKHGLGFIGSSWGSQNSKLRSSLHGTALLFRLLRVHGLENPRLISLHDLLKSFKLHFDEDDAKGMLSLYEAFFLAMADEDEDDEVEEAMKFTTRRLAELRKTASNAFLAKQIDHALGLPLHWSTPRQHTRWFIFVYEKQDRMEPKLLQFAKLDFNMAQNLHKKELKELSSWWRNAGLACEELSFARARPVEIYLWILVCTFEPQFWKCRKVASRFGCLVVLVDDIYDLYGTLEELELFTAAVEEWNVTKIEHLPKYMQITLRAVFDTVNDIAGKCFEEKGLDILPHLKRLWKDQCKSFMAEAVWYHKGYTPELDEYLENAWITISVQLYMCCAYFLSEDLTLEALENFEYYPDAVRYSSIISRLYDDLGTSTDELQRGDVPKSIQCCMKEKNISEHSARDYIRHLISEYWKKLNGEHIEKAKSEAYKRCVLNIPNVALLFYHLGDGFGKAGHEIKDNIISLLIQPITI